MSRADDIERDLLNLWGGDEDELMPGEVTVKRAAEAYAALLRSIETGEYPKVARFPSHHVLLGHDDAGERTWTIEHPATCDLSTCEAPDHFAAVVAEYGWPPQPDGWHALGLDCYLADPEARVSSVVVPLALFREAATGQQDTDRCAACGHSRFNHSTEGCDWQPFVESDPDCEANFMPGAPKWEGCSCGGFREAAGDA